MKLIILSYRNSQGVESIEQKLDLVLSGEEHLKKRACCLEEPKGGKVGKLLILLQDPRPKRITISTFVVALLRGLGAGIALPTEDASAHQAQTPMMGHGMMGSGTSGQGMMGPGMGGQGTVPPGTGCHPVLAATTRRSSCGNPVQSNSPSLLSTLRRGELVECFEGFCAVHH